MAFYKEITKEMIEDNPKFWVSAFGGHNGYSWNQVKDTKTGSVLPNCTGMAAGLFNFQYYLQTGKRNPLYEQAFRFEAQNFWWMVTEPNNVHAILYGKLKYGKTVKKGGLMVWSGTDGNGHVAYACEDESNGTVKVLHSTSSGKGGKYYWEVLSNKNGRWGYSTAYTYLGCIYPEFEWEEEKLTDPVPRNFKKHQIQVLSSTLRVRTEPNLYGKVLGFAKQLGYYNVLGRTEADGYTWYHIAPGNWCAKVDPYVKFFDVVDINFKNGDDVMIKKGALTYTGRKLPDWTYEATWRVLVMLNKTTAVITAKDPTTQKTVSVMVKATSIVKII